MSVLSLDDCAGLNCPGHTDPSFDWTQCINAAAQAAGQGGVLLFTRGKTYRFSGQLVTSGSFGQESDNTTWGATGAGARPILLAENISGQAIKVNGVFA
jgi:hypothetical protein